MSYISPITLKIAKQFENDVENPVIKEVRRVGVYVDKDELFRALRYDRYQYDLGYSEGFSDGEKSAAKKIMKAIITKDTPDPIAKEWKRFF